MKINLFLFISILWVSCYSPSDPEPWLSIDSGSNSYNDGIISMNREFVFLNKKGKIIRMDHNGNNQKDLIQFNQGNTPSELSVRDSVLVMSNSSKALYIMGYKELYTNKITYPAYMQLHLSDALAYRTKMLVLNSELDNLYDKRVKGGMLQLFDFNPEGRSMRLIKDVYRDLYADGFFTYKDSIIYSYNYTSLKGHIEFSRFDMNDTTPLIEEFGFDLQNKKHAIVSVCREGETLYISDGNHIYICEMVQKVFVMRKVI